MLPHLVNIFSSWICRSQLTRTIKNKQQEQTKRVERKRIRNRRTETNKRDRRYKDYKDYKTLIIRLEQLNNHNNNNNYHHYMKDSQDMLVKWQWINNLLRPFLRRYGDDYLWVITRYLPLFTEKNNAPISLQFLCCTY